MLIPNADAAVVDPDKLRHYCLDPTHPLGKFKARVFASALGITAEDTNELAEALLEAVKKEDATPGRADEFGTRYVVDFELERSGKSAIIRSAWIIEPNKGFPRLITCFVL